MEGGIKRPSATGSRAGGAGLCAANNDDPPIGVNPRTTTTNSVLNIGNIPLECPNPIAIGSREQSPIVAAEVTRLEPLSPSHSLRDSQPSVREKLEHSPAVLKDRPMLWEKVTLIGVGLLGGSLGLALRERGLAKNVTGYVRRKASIDECRRCGAVDTATSNLLEATAGADLIIFCTPLGQMKPLAEQMLPAIAKDALITDVGSVKASVAKDLEPIAKKAGAHFVGSHPMAGSEQTGVCAARADLFKNAICVVTAARLSSHARKIEDLWRSVGGRPVRMTAAQHDEFVSRSSHLPHVVAAELVNYVLSPVHPPDQAAVCATGFRDTTRIASGSPEMWRDIALANRENLARVLGVFIDDLKEFQHALDTGNVAAIEEFFRHAKERRDAWRGPQGTASD